MARAVRRTPVRIAIAVVLVAVAWYLCIGIPGLSDVPPYRIDLDVYRLGAGVWLQGGDLYGQLPKTQIGVALPFTYPPIAAVLLAPLVWLPLPVASVVVGIASVLALYGVVWLATRELSDLTGADLAWFSAGATACSLLLGPVRETFGYGQINLFLMLLVVVDMVAGRGRWWRGSLTGIAAAIKLTPAVFFLFFLLRKDFRAIVVGGLAFVAAHAIGFLAAWDDSVTYWTTTLRDTSRIGGLAYAANQSLNGFLYRLGLTGTVAQVAWLVLVVLLVAAAAVLMVRLIGSGEELAAVVVVAFAGLYASPVSWAHHWVWAVPALLVCAWWAMRRSEVVGPGLRGCLWALVVAGVAVFASTPYWWFPHEENREIQWEWYMHLFGNANLWWGLALFAAMWWYTVRVRRVAPARG
ncbi:glycosyltransferase 87 family protein [Propionicicella superfundia]|uniref:glycosyltransferase 87 family protein n=1 Tax=Propionicicella superfundia TaxID=348582 RepID=UPI00146C8836|nr:glycosyltransferase 87 family protein [Propionicicella superfundia]